MNLFQLPTGTILAILSLGSLIVFAGLIARSYIKPIFKELDIEKEERDKLSKLMASGSLLYYKNKLEAEKAVSEIKSPPVKHRLKRSLDISDVPSTGSSSYSRRSSCSEGDMLLGVAAGAFLFGC